MNTVLVGVVHFVLSRTLSAAIRPPHFVQGHGDLQWRNAES